MKIGVLAIQGSIAEHKTALENAGAQVVLVKTAEDLGKVSGLIIPGGESTAISHLLNINNLDREIIKRVKAGMPIYGTCAGAIVLAKEISKNKGTNCPVKNLGLMDIVMARNAYGRQIDSFETEFPISILGKKKFPGVFIRAPKIKKIGKKVRILAKYSGEIVMAKEGNMIISTFHPELTEDKRIHEWFVRTCAHATHPSLRYGGQACERTNRTNIRTKNFNTLRWKK